jgi:hypothetical protein
MLSAGSGGGICRGYSWPGRFCSPPSGMGWGARGWILRRFLGSFERAFGFGDRDTQGRWWIWVDKCIYVVLYPCIHVLSSCRLAIPMPPSLLSLLSHSITQVPHPSPYPECCFLALTLLAEQYLYKGPLLSNLENNQREDPIILGP